MDKLAKVRAEVEKRYKYWRDKEHNSHSIESEARMSECQHLLLLFNSIQEEPVSEDLIKAARKYAMERITSPEFPVYNNEYEVACAFEDGANWQKNKMMEGAIQKEVFTSFGGNKVIKVDGFSDGDRIKIIVVREEE